MLHIAYADYLRSGALPDSAGRLADALSRHGLATEGWLLREYGHGGTGRFRPESGPHAGSSIFVGPRVPAAETGALWFDSCGLALMVLLPAYVAAEDADALSEEARARLDDERSWFALRPTLRFQFGAFLDVASIEATTTSRAGLRAFDRERILRGDQVAPMTHVTCGEAGLYLFWFGTSFASETEWLAARSLGIAPWSKPAREWTGESSFDDNLCVAISPTTLELDPQDTDGTTDPDLRMLYAQWSAPSDVTFRPMVRLQYGLKLQNVASAPDTFGRVLGRFARPAP